MAPVRRYFFFQAEDGIRDLTVTGVQTCALPIMAEPHASGEAIRAPSGTGRMARRHRGEIFSVYQRSLRLPARNALRARMTSARASSLVAASAVRCPIFLPARAVAFPYR